MLGCYSSAKQAIRPVFFSTHGGRLDHDPLRAGLTQATGDDTIKNHSHSRKKYPMARKIHVVINPASGQPQPVQMDSELAGETPVSIQVVPGIVRGLSPA